MGINLSINLNPFKISFGSGAGQKKSIMSQTLATNVQRLRQDVGKWRAALASAESVYYPDRTQLYNIYADVVLDLHLTAVMQSRLNAVIRRPFKLQDAKETEQPVLTKLLRKPWFYKFCTYALERNFYGHSLIEFPVPVGGEFKDCQLVPRQYVSPELGIVRSMPGMIVGTDFRNDPSFSPWLIEVGEEKDLGLLNKVAAMALYKKNVVAAWADFTEVHGMPFRMANTEAEGDELEKIEEIMREMGQSAYGVFPEDVKVSFIAAPTSNERLYDSFISRANSELSKGVLGQTMTTDAGASLSQSEVHERVAEGYTAADSDFLASLINEQLLPFLIRHGYELQGCEFVWDTAEQLTKEALFKITQGIMKDSGYQVNKAWLEKTFGIELEEKPAPPAALPPPAAPGAPPAPGGAGPGGPADDEQPTGEQEELPGKRKGPPAPVGPNPTAQLQALYSSTSCCTTHVLATASAAAGPAADDEQLAALWARLVRVVYAGANDGAGLLLDLPLFEYIDKQLQAAVEIGWNATDPALKKYLSKNVQRFSGFKSHKVCQELTRKLYDTEGKLLDFVGFKAEAEQLGQLYNVAYLKTEYEQAVAAAQMASKWAGFAPTDLLQYRTVGDSLVRPEHQEYDLVTLPASHPWWATHYPPNDWNCRCDAVDLVDSDQPVTGVEVLIELPKPPDLFANNVGKDGQIFGPEHPYFDVPAKTAAKIEQQLKLDF
jgi:hypothetical protein